MSYASNKIISEALLSRSFSGSDGAAYISDVLNDIDNQECRAIASIIADGLKDTDGIDSVDCAEIGRRFVERVVAYVAKRKNSEIKREEDKQAEDSSQDEINEEHRTADNRARADDMRRAA